MTKPVTKNRRPDKIGELEKQESFIVTTRDYKESFTSKDEAKTKYEALKAHAEKNKQPTTIKLSKKVGSTSTVICSVNIKESHFED